MGEVKRRMAMHLTSGLGKSIPCHSSVALGRLIRMLRASQTSNCRTRFDLPQPHAAGCAADDRNRSEIYSTTGYLPKGYTGRSQCAICNGGAATVLSKLYEQEPRATVRSGQDRGVVVERYQGLRGRN